MKESIHEVDMIVAMIKGRLSGLEYYLSSAVHKETIELAKAKKEAYETILNEIKEKFEL